MALHVISPVRSNSVAFRTEADISRQARLAGSVENDPMTPRARCAIRRCCPVRSLWGGNETARFHTRKRGDGRFKGRVSGFTEGTGSTLALLPPENATGNFIKVVQRLPVRIDLEDYDPDENTLFNGTSVVPYVYVKKPPTVA